MTRSKPRLVVFSGAENPARAQLAELIASGASAQKRAHNARQAVERAAAMVTEAEERHESAKDAVAQARQQRAKRIRDAALAGSGQASSAGIAEVVSQAAVAEEDLAAYKAAHEQCQIDAEEAEAIAADTRVPLAAAVAAVIKSEPGFLQGVLMEAERIQTESASQRVALWWLLKNGLVPEDMIEAVDAFLVSRDHVPGTPGKPPVHQGASQYLSIEHRDWMQHEVTKRLEQFREALYRDANVELPKLS